ncbi:carbohydrate porin [Pleurocapsales cyanobacterium LEGE 10410]|nr:carbohydrate porin [Pleurocapsales cyanobacterium LEGE 10410]
MNRLFWQTVKVTPLVFAASLLAANNANAQSVSAEKEGVNQTLEQINNYQRLGDDLPQVTNVNQLRDVSPTDWAYEALRSLVDRYGCIAGFPNQTYRGSQPLTRYEFAAGLNSCLNQIERLIASQGSLSQQDIDTINRLAQEFEAELATIGGRVDELESRTAVLEDNQFSTTTVLNGEAIFSISDAFGGGVDLESITADALDIDDSDVTDAQIITNFGIGDLDGDGDVDGDDIDEFEDETELDDETVFGSRVRLNFDTSFFGDDRLRTRLEGGNITDYGDVTTDSARLGFDTNNDFNIDVTDLWYRFSATDRVTAYVGAFGLDLDDIFNVTNPSLESSGTGALSRFSRRNPVVFRGNEGAGAGAQVEVIPDRLGINFGYLTDNGEGDTGASSPDEGEGLFNGSFSAGGQVVFNPLERLEVSATYVRNYQTADEINQSGSTVGGLLDGGFATSPFGNGAFAVDVEGVTSNKIGAGVSFDLNDRIQIAGFGGYADVEGLVAGDDNNPDGEIWTWGANVSFFDLGKEGSQLSIAGGMLPKFITDRGAEEVAAGAFDDLDTSYLVEALYKFPLNDNILITPGAYAVFNPNHVDGNDTVYVGVVRTTFQF